MTNRIEGRRCETCGYDITGSDGVCCPECGSNPVVPPRPGTAWFANSLLLFCCTLTGIIGLIMAEVEAFYGPAMLAHMAQWLSTSLLGLISIFRVLYVQRVAQYDPDVGRWRELRNVCVRVGIAILALVSSYYILEHGGFFAV